MRYENLKGQVMIKKVWITPVHSSWLYSAPPILVDEDSVNGIIWESVKDKTRLFDFDCWYFVKGFIL